MYKIVVNKIRCKFCGDIIESKSVHDFVQCRCKKCSTDGGHEYTRRTFDGKSPEDVFEDLTVYLDTDTGKLVDARSAADIPPKPAEKPEVPREVIPEPEQEVEPPVDIPEVIEEQSDEPEKPAELKKNDETVFKTQWKKRKYY